MTPEPTESPIFDAIALDTFAAQLVHVRDLADIPWGAL